MTYTATVSLIIPTYDMAPYVADAINSALAQTVPYTQIIVVDDGSRDDTAKVLDQFGKKITLIRQENQGVSVARNTGSAAATGTYLAFLDADDLLLPDCLERQLSLFEAHPDTEFCDALSRYFRCPRMSQADRKADHRHGHDFWRQSFPGHISSWLMRRDMFERVGAFEPGVAYSEDTDWRLRSKAAGVKARRLDHHVSERRLHPTNATNHNRAGNAAGLMAAIRKHRARLATSPNVGADQ